MAREFKITDLDQGADSIELLPTFTRATRSPLSDAHYEAIGRSIEGFSLSINAAFDTAETGFRGQREVLVTRMIETVDRLASRLLDTREEPEEIVSDPITERESPRFLHEIEDFPKVVEVLRSTLEWLEKLRDEGESMRNEICEPDYLSEIKKIIHVARVNAKSSGVDLS